MRRPAVLVAALVVGAACLTGCVRVPDDGPVVTSKAGSQLDEQPAGQADAVPPAPGASRQAIVTGFLDAMTAWPVQTNVVKEYLTDDSAEAWNPEAGTIVYSDSSPPEPEDDGAGVSVHLSSGDRLDASGGWRGSLGPREETLHFKIGVEDGEFRIIDPPNALIVPASWFQQRYRQVSVYYFDPTSKILVPEPVFVPVGQQLATSLVSALLTGPPRRLRDVITTYVPHGLDEGLSVPVSDSGVAELSLSGDAPQPSPDSAQLMLAQFAWTLQQDPQVTAVRLSIGGTGVTLPSGATQYDLADAADFDPAGNLAAGELFGVRNGRVVSGTPDLLAPVTGPFGKPGYGPAELAVAPQGARAAIVTQDRAHVLEGPVLDVNSPTQVTTIVSDGVDLARPTWDYAGRLWLLDRGPDGARVRVVEGRDDDSPRVRHVRVPGVTGQDARRLLVSRDGTRLVAVVRRGDATHLVIARVTLGVNGRVDGAGLSTVIGGIGGASRIVDIAWTSPSTIAVLTPVRRGSLFEVDTVVADGSTLGEDAGSTIVTGRVRGLAGSPDVDQPSYAVLGRGLTDLVTRVATEIGGGAVTLLDYAG
ncbi:LpqB family beta-propeller domain-containing protein [Nocardioides panacisoli]|uniref:LpqB family beta-propeller domain-containing protein n=1 Tax=Nocardioides panacisoli TaxID=627624 RepID=A0ABP7I0R7_9ACTN